MNTSAMRKLLVGMVALVLLAAGCGGGEEDAQPAAGGDAAAGGGGEVSTYNVAWLSDFSGPYADIWPDVQAAHEAVQAWWNENVGAEIGVEMAGETFDTRYDAAQVASLWPGILSDLQPIGAMGVGGPSVAALQERLPDDGVGLYMSTAAYGYAWEPDPWVFNPRPTYAHEAAGFLQWYREQQGVDVLGVGTISSQASPAYVDIVEGSQSFVEANEGFEWVGVEYADVQPVSLDEEVRRLVDGGADVILTQTNTAAAVLAAQVLESMGNEDVATMVSSHNSLTASGEAGGGLELFNGMYEAYSMAIPAAEEGPAFEFYTTLQEDYGLEAEWDVPVVQGMLQQLYFLRIVEQAVEENGAENLTGINVREAAVNISIPAEDLFGLVPYTLQWNNLPFPTEELAVNVGVVQEGEYMAAEVGAPVPELEDWTG